MDTKEITLKQKLNTESLTEKQYDAILEAMDTHARNCMIEMLVYLRPTTYTHEQAAKVVDNVLQKSDYFKELQK